MPTRMYKWPSVIRLLKLLPGEQLLLALSFSYFFLILASYYVLRPIRDEIGVAGGVEKLPWLFLGTLVATVALSPMFSALVSRLPRRRFAAWSYRIMIALLLVFYVFLRDPSWPGYVYAGRAFFIWLSIFNIFVVSLFWAVMSDVFRTDQASRLYGLIGAGGTLGALCGGLLTSLLVSKLGTVSLLLISAVLLEAALRCMFALTKHAATHGEQQARIDQEVIGGNSLAGLSRVARSSYLIGIASFMLLYTVGSTFLYFLQAQIVVSEIADRAARTIYFAHVDIWVNALTLITQFGFTGRLLSSLGIGRTLILLPILSIAGFAWLGMTPTLSAVIIFQVLRRAGNFAITGPARETLYVPLAREDKYKSKNFIDTFMFRVGDQLGAWSYTALLLLGFGISGIAIVAAPLSCLWLMLAIWLGRRHALLLLERDASPSLSAGTALGQS
jgi:AAA family ATP:ADP antiporter